MADISIGNNVQVLPPLQGKGTPGRKEAPLNAPGDSSRNVTPSGGATPGVNIAGSAGVSLYDTVSTVTSGREADTATRQQSPRLGSVIDIEA